MLNEWLDTERLQQLDLVLQCTVLVLLAIGTILLVAGIRRYFRGRFISATVQSLSGLTLILAGLLFVSVAMNLYTYQRLTYERAVANLAFEQIAPQQYRVMLTVPTSQTTQQYELLGDEWQLDARIIKWHPMANLFGLNSQYRLERISGRYHDVEEERDKARSVYALREAEPVDYWQLARDYQRYLPWIDTYYGSATYLPMADGARYVVTITQSGLVARPVNEPARQRSRSW